jgi:hypothetical protein
MVILEIHYITNDIGEDAEYTVDRVKIVPNV